jgi:hypothetical protein
MCQFLITSYLIFYTTQHFRNYVSQVQNLKFMGEFLFIIYLPQQTIKIFGSLLARAFIYSSCVGSVFRTNLTFCTIRYLLNDVILEELKRETKSPRSKRDIFCKQKEKQHVTSN